MDIAILKFFNVTIACPPFDKFFALICDFRIWRWLFAVIGIVLLWKGGAKGRWAVAIAVLSALIIDPSVYHIFKPLFGRIRPCHELALDWVRAVAGCGGRYGFPSSHAANVFGLAVVFSVFYKTTRYYLFPIAALVAIGRVYLGVHYPSDVLAGAIYGTLVAWGVIFLARRFGGFRVEKYLKSGVVDDQKD